MDLSQDEWSIKLANDSEAIIIDVRTKEECAEGIIPKAICIDIYKGQGFIYEVDVFDKTKNIFVYCKSGGRSSQACNILNQIGFEKTYNLIGGFMDWDGDVEIHL